MYIVSKELNKNKIIYDGDNSTIYDIGNGLLAKKCKCLVYKDLVIKKILRASKFQMIEYLAKPIDVLETEKGIEGFIMSRIKGVNFVDYYNENKNITLDEITEYISNTEDVIKQTHELGMVNPDLASGNTIYNPSTRESYITDYEGTQIDELPSHNISTFIYYPFHRIIDSRKYNHGDLYTKDIDILTLALRYFYYCTKIDLGKNMRNKKNLKYILKDVGINNTEFAELILRVFDYDLENKYISDSIKEINKQYILTPNIPRQPRTFIRK